MKKILSYILFITILVLAVFSLTACSNVQSSELPRDPVNDEFSTDSDYDFDEDDTNNVEPTPPDDTAENVEPDYLADHNWQHSYSVTADYMVCEDCKLTSLPIVSITTDGGELTKEYSDCLISVISYSQDYSFEDSSAQIKVRGNGTAVLPKLPYRIKFDSKQSMLGLNNGLKAKSWVLLAEYSDNSMLKNATALYLGNQILSVDGYYVSDYRFIDLYINSEYQGVYLLAEQQQVNSGRVNITEPQDGYEGIDIGYFFELDSYYATEDVYFDITYDDLKFIDGTDATTDLFVNYYVIKSDVYSSAQVEFLQQTLQNIWTVIYDAAYNDHGDLTAYPYKTLDENYNIIDDESVSTAREAVEKVVDVRSLADTFLLQELCEDLDVGWSSFYLSIDCGSNGNRKLTFQAPWDFDLSMQDAANNSNTLFTCSESTAWHNLVNPWLIVLSQQDWFMQEVINKWTEIRTYRVIENAIARIELYTTQYSEFFARNHAMWELMPSQYTASILLKDYILARTELLDAYFAEYGAQSDSGFKITFILDEHATVYIFDGQDYSTVPVQSNVAYSKNADTGLFDSSGEGQINFMIVFDDGYEPNEILVTEGYKNIKYQGNNIYRITKITDDLTVTVSSRLSD